MDWQLDDRLYQMEKKMKLMKQRQEEEELLLLMVFLWPHIKSFSKWFWRTNVWLFNACTYRNLDRSTIKEYLKR